MWKAALPRELLRDAIRKAVGETPVTFARLTEQLPQIKGTEDFSVCTGLVLWRGLSHDGVAALHTLHTERSIFFWLCPPSIYARTDAAPFMRLMSRSHRPGEQSWLPTLIFSRPPTMAESREAVRDYVAELAHAASFAS
jgi:hypothetical protein